MVLTRSHSLERDVPLQAERSAQAFSCCPTIRFVPFVHSTKP